MKTINENAIAIITNDNIGQSITMDAKFVGDNAIIAQMEENVNSYIRRGDMQKLAIQYLPINKLKPYEGNAKEHPQEQIEQIKESIRQFGMNDPIGIWGDNCLIVEGHGRLIALKQMGETEVPTIRLDHMTDEQRRAYTLAHNKTTMSSGFDMELLRMELEAIESIEMEDFGFTMDELQEDEFPDELDAEASEDYKTIVKFTFDDYKTYAAVEEKMKEFADEVGAKMTVSGT